MASNPSNRTTKKFWIIQSPNLKLRAVVDAAALWETLTNREREVALLAGQRLTNKQIAKQLGISEKTVGNHLEQVFSKLDINSRREIKYILEQIENDF